MLNFWDFSVWSKILLFAVLFVSLLVANIVKKALPFLQKSLIPTSVLAGGVLVLVEFIYKLITGDVFFDSSLFDYNGTAALEVITYHTLALGFIASALKSSDKKLTKKRTTEIFNSGVTTVATYLLQGIIGLAITIIAAFILTDFFSAAGILLPFGYGQGTGQALNYGNIFEVENGFVGGKSFGLTIAAFGFISASVGGVIHLNIAKRRGRLKPASSEHHLTAEEIESPDEIPMQESIDKLTVQVALISLSYFMTYGIMQLLGLLLPGMRSTIFGFNFLLGVLCAMLVKTVLKFFKKRALVKKEYLNNFLLTRTSNFFFDIMVVSGIAAIRLDILEKYWGILLILSAAGLVSTFLYCRFIANVLFKEYSQEQFLATYGMLTGTACTGIILLREIDGDFKTPAADNLVYQNLPAIVFGFPLMLIATLAPKMPVITLVIIIAFFIVMNIILFRSFIFKRSKKGNKKE